MEQGDEDRSAPGNCFKNTRIAVKTELFFKKVEYVEIM